MKWAVANGWRTDNPAAVLFAYEMDWPVNVSITVTWPALIEAGEHNEGHCLGKSASSRDIYLWREIARLARREGIPLLLSGGVILAQPWEAM